MNTPEHLITCLGEEGIEVALELAKVCSKTNRFGLREVSVADPAGPDNTERLVNELNDLLGVVAVLVEEGILPRNWQNFWKQTEKRRRVRHFMAYAREQGVLT